MAMAMVTGHHQLGNFRFLCVQLYATNNGAGLAQPWPVLCSYLVAFFDEMYGSHGVKTRWRWRNLVIRNQGRRHRGRHEQLRTQQWRDGRHPGSGEHWPSGESDQRRRCQFALVITQRA